MGQTVSSVGVPAAISRSFNSSHRMRTKTAETISSPATERSCYLSYLSEDGDELCELGRLDFVSDLPDECLALVFQWLGPGDRKRCSLVCRRWLRVEGESRHRLSLDARCDLLREIPSIFSRFDSISKLALKCDRQFVSIGDEAMVMISLRCRNITRLKLRSCREITETGMAAVGRNCRSLKKLSCGSCAFGARGINAVLEYAGTVEELSIKRLRGLTESAAADSIRPGAAAASLKNICLKELYNGQCFGPLIIGSKNLKSLKLYRCSGDWDWLLEGISLQRVSGMSEIHLERLHVSDRGLVAISHCLDLEILHLVKTPECTNAGLVSIADRCKLLRKLHIDGCKTGSIGDNGLSAIARQCPNLQELVLIGVNPTSSSLTLLASNCRNLERLALCSSETIGDAEISCIAAKCLALRKLCIKGCPVSDQGMEALAEGCPNLVKVKVKKCRGVTYECAEWLRMNRASLVVNLDNGSTKHHDVSVNNVGGELFPEAHQGLYVEQSIATNLPSSRRSALAKARSGFFVGRNFVACSFRRWSQSNCSTHGN